MYTLKYLVMHNKELQLLPLINYLCVFCIDATGICSLDNSVNSLSDNKGILSKTIMLKKGKKF